MESLVGMNAHGLHNIVVEFEAHGPRRGVTETLDAEVVDERPRCGRLLMGLKRRSAYEQKRQQERCRDGAGG